MDLRDAPAQQDGPSTDLSTPPPLRRRLSMEEDYFYQEIMTSPPRPAQPPPYRRHPPSPPMFRNPAGSGKGKAPEVEGGGKIDYSDVSEEEELPDYSTSILLEGVFAMKHEIENTTKRAEDRQWHNVYVVLQGTALCIHRTKKDWGWGRTRDDGPSVNPDNPPWVKKGSLEKTYSLLYADVGIAADYKKRRYVIRLRAETDQFLLSCVELSTFITWLDGLFAAIDVAAPLDDREFPRDMSIPRIQRVRWFRGEAPTQTTIDLSELNIPPTAGESSSAGSRRASDSTITGPEPQTRVEQEPDVGEVEETPLPPPRIDPVHRLSITSYPNLAVDPGSGKWLPEHQWSKAHDMLYAKLCYSNLLFRSPRKSNYIISKGKQWFVDWTTGRMLRVLPPAYGEIEWFGPWQVIHTENRRI